jgi:hypothetical protein
MPNHSLDMAKARLDEIISKARTDMYKPIQIAEVLHHSRHHNQNIDIQNTETYRNSSLRWRNEVTLKLIGKVSTSSARYQHDVWNPTAMPSELLAVLDEENRRTSGLVERYIYMRYGERQSIISAIISAVSSATPETFQLQALLNMFISERGIRRSLDKAYEIVVYSLFETVVTTLGTKISVSVPSRNRKLLQEFSDLTSLLLGVDENVLSWEQPAHLYRVGVTNAADRGLDIWANFGCAVQVKHLTLNSKLANQIVDQIESDHIVIVCRDADAQVIETIAKQISWGQRVRGIVKESNLLDWYERCLRGKFSNQLAAPLLQQLCESFNAEFPQASTLADFLEERGYNSITLNEYWYSETDRSLARNLN